METYILQKDVSVFGRQVETFPKGIKETFTELIDVVPDGLQRSHYGLSYIMPDGKIVYIAASAEKTEGEAEKLNYKRYIIEKGEYLVMTLINWMNKTDSIGSIFHEMKKDSRADLTKMAIEWYKSDEEMMCMMKMK